MCGFFGCFNFRNEQLSTARQALHTMIHRGSDQWNEWYDETIYLGHRRLSILDLSEQGRQPFVNEHLAIVVNGEIYNFKALRKELGESLFKSDSDSEVIMHGYKVWGINGLLERIDGMYAFAIYDRKLQKLILGKDRWGKKPLFYALHDGQLLFASEIKALFEFAPSLKVFSFEGIKHWISYRGSHSESTIFHDVHRISPATFVTCTKSLDIQRVKYYSLIDVCTKKMNTTKSEDIQEQLKTLLNQSIDKRLISDVPLGLQLSGGVDSSLIAAFLKDKVSDFHAFSVVFSEPEYQSYSEDEYSQRVAKQWNYHHHSFGITKKMIGENFERVVYLFDGMLDYPNAIPLYLLNLYSKQFISVCLTGEAADELFGGYSKYLNVSRLKDVSSFAQFAPKFLFDLKWNKKLGTHFLRPLYLKKKYSGDANKVIENLNSFISEETFSLLFGETETKLVDTIDYQQLKMLPFERQVVLSDHLTYLYSLLDRQDRTSMGANIEARLPFLDKELVEWGVGLDTNILFDKNETKKPLKTLAAELYDTDFAYRKKMGFPLPLLQWLEAEDCFGKFHKKINDDNFLLYQKVNKSKLMAWLSGNSFDRKLLNYNDSERMWVRWFLMVLRSTQDIFGIYDIR